MSDLQCSLLGMQLEGCVTEGSAYSVCQGSLGLQFAAHAREEEGTIQGQSVIPCKLDQRASPSPDPIPPRRSQQSIAETPNVLTQIDKTLENTKTNSHWGGVPPVQSAVDRDPDFAGQFLSARSVDHYLDFESDLRVQANSNEAAVGGFNSGPSPGSVETESSERYDQVYVQLDALGHRTSPVSRCADANGDHGEQMLGEQIMTNRIRQVVACNTRYAAAAVPAILKP